MQRWLVRQFFFALQLRCVRVLLAVPLRNIAMNEWMNGTKWANVTILCK